MGQVGFLTKVCFIWGAPNGTVPQPIFQVDGVEQCIGPETGWEARGVEKTPYHDAEGLVQAFNSAILRGSVGAGGFDDIAVFGDDLAELLGTGEFATLVHANRAWRVLVLEAVSGQKHVEDVDWWLLRGGVEAPGLAAAGISDKAVGIVSVKQRRGTRGIDALHRDVQCC